MQQIRAFLQSLSSIASECVSKTIPLGVPLDEILFFRLRIFRSSLWKMLFPTVLSIAARSGNDEKYNKRRRKSGAVSSAQSRMTAADTSAPLDECRFESTNLTEIWNNLRQLDSIKDNGLIMPSGALLWKLSRRGLSPGVILRFTRNSSL